MIHPGPPSPVPSFLTPLVVVVEAILRTFGPEFPAYALRDRPGEGKIGHTVPRKVLAAVWIPAFAGMTEGKAGMTEREAGMTEGDFTRFAEPWCWMWPGQRGRAPQSAPLSRRGWPWS